MKYVSANSMYSFLVARRSNLKSGVRENDSNVNFLIEKCMTVTGNGYINVLYKYWPDKNMYIWNAV